MATNNKAEYEEIMIPRAQANEDPNLFVAVNGVSYILPKGKKSKVPKYVAEEVRRSWDAQAAADDRIAKMEEAAGEVAKR